MLSVEWQFAKASSSQDGDGSLGGVGEWVGFEECQSAPTCVLIGNTCKEL